MFIFMIVICFPLWVFLFLLCCFFFYLCDAEIKNCLLFLLSWKFYLMFCANGASAYKVLLFKGSSKLCLLVHFPRKVMNFLSSLQTDIYNNVRKLNYRFNPCNSRKNISCRQFRQQYLMLQVAVNAISKQDPKANIWSQEG